MHIMDIDYQCRTLCKSQPPWYSFETGRYDQFQIIYVISGRLGFGSKTANVTLGEGGIALLPKTSAFGLFTRSLGYRGVGFIATGPLPPEWVSDTAEPLQASAEAHMLGELINRQISSPGPEATRVLEGLGRALAWEALRISQANRKPKHELHWPMLAKAAIEANLHTFMPISEIFKSLPVSYRHVARMFNETFGMSPKAFQIRQKIAHAQRLLVETSMSVTDIAMEMGFSSSQHFANTFRTQTGMTPSAWIEHKRAD